MTKLKITVVKGFTAREIFGENIPEYFGENMGPCSKHKVGEEFILKGTSCPEGFCNWAYADFQKHLVRLYLREKGRESYYLTCTDGMHPVVFRVEKIKE